jgi:hypothetical protein
MVNYLPDLCKFYDIINSFWLGTAIWEKIQFKQKFWRLFSKLHISTLPHFALQGLFYMSLKILNFSLIFGPMVVILLKLWNLA